MVLRGLGLVIMDKDCPRWSGLVFRFLSGSTGLRMIPKGLGMIGSGQIDL